MKRTMGRTIGLLVPALISGAMAASIEAADASKLTQQNASSFAARQPISLQPYFKKLYLEGEHNAVLNFDYLGLAALEAGQYAIAERASIALRQSMRTIRQRRRRAASLQGRRSRTSKVSPMSAR